MDKKRSVKQIIGGLLETSSETFMLIALVSLFAFPFVVAEALKPVVVASEQSASVYTSPKTAVIVLTATPVAQVIAPTTSNVLGVQVSKTLPFTVTENSTNLAYFDVHNSSSTATSYSLDLTTQQLYGKLSILDIKNTDNIQHTFKINVVNNMTGIKQTDKIMYIGNNSYVISSAQLPTTITLNPSENATISVSSLKSRATNITFQLMENN